MSGAPPDPRRSYSLECGVAMLECFSADHHAWTIAQLARRLGFSPSTTHRYAQTLVLLGYLAQDQRRRYCLARADGPGINAVTIRRLETPTADPALRDLRELTGHTVSMAALDGFGAVYIHRFFAHGLGQYAADLDLRVGAIVPLHCTAIGKALLASLKARELRQLLGKLPFDQEGPTTITRQGVLEEEIVRIQTSGIATCDEEQAVGVRSIAAAISRPGLSQPLAISLTVPAQRYTVEKMTSLFANRIKHAAARI